MIDRLKALWNRKALRMAYRRLLDPQNVDGALIVADLARFCRARTTTVAVGSNGSIDPLAMALAEGRREVFNRILAQAALNDADIDHAIQQEML
jgi:hypothetical protein